jgi:hypothetical protein
VTPDEMKALRALAEGASPGARHVMSAGPDGDDERPLWWIDREYDEDARCCWVDRVLGENAEADARYIAAASPDVVLALLDRIEALEAVRFAAVEYTDAYRLENDTEEGSVALGLLRALDAVDALEVKP